jgi:hypothetical protein
MVRFLKTMGARIHGGLGNVALIVAVMAVGMKKPAARLDAGSG